MHQSDFGATELAEAAAGCQSWYAIASILTKLPGEATPDRQATIAAFEYTLIDEVTGSDDGRVAVGGPFAPLSVFDGVARPPLLDDVPDDLLARWAALSDAVSLPEVCSRLDDLLWCRRYQPAPHQRAQNAMDALLVVAANAEWVDPERLSALQRSLELARQLRDDRRVTNGIEVARQLVVDAAAPNPRLAQGALAIIASQPSKYRPADLRALIEQTLDVVRDSDDVDLEDLLLDLLDPLLSVAERTAMRDRQLRARYAAAMTIEGARRAFALERVVEMANTHGMADVRDQARVALQAVGEAELNLKTISAEVSVPADEIDRFVSQFEAASTSQDALISLGSMPCPTGPRDAIREAAAGQASSIRRLMTRTIMSPIGAQAIFVANTQEDHQHLDEIEQLEWRAGIWGHVCAQILTQIGERADAPTASELASFFENDVLDSEAAAAVARAFHYFWAGDADAAAHVLVPRIERAFRQLAHRAGIPIVKGPDRNKPGGVIGLGAVLNGAKEVLPDSDWHFYFVHLLADPLSINLRNRIAHGLTDAATAPQAALLLQVPCYLRTLSFRASAEPASQTA